MSSNETKLSMTAIYFLGQTGCRPQILIKYLVFWTHSTVTYSRPSDPRKTEWLLLWLELVFQDVDVRALPLSVFRQPEDGRTTSQQQTDYKRHESLWTAGWHRTLSCPYRLEWGRKSFILCPWAWSLTWQLMLSHTWLGGVNGNIPHMLLDT